MTERELLVAGLTSDELRALRPLSRTTDSRSDRSYLAHLQLIARAAGSSGRLARIAKAADLTLGASIPVSATTAGRHPMPERCNCCWRRPMICTAQEPSLWGRPRQPLRSLLAALVAGGQLAPVVDGPPMSELVATSLLARLVHVTADRESALALVRDQ